LIRPQIQDSKGDLLIYAGGEELVIRLLKHDPDLPPHLKEAFSRIFHRLSVNKDPSLIRLPDPVQAQEKCGLAGAVSSQEGDFSAAADLQINSVQRLFFISFVCITEVLCLNDPVLSLHFIIPHIVIKSSTVSNPAIKTISFFFGGY